MSQDDNRERSLETNALGDNLSQPQYHFFSMRGNIWISIYHTLNLFYIIFLNMILHITWETKAYGNAILIPYFINQKTNVSQVA